MNRKISIVLLLALTLALGKAQSAAAQDPSNGAALFAEKCTACHSIGKGALAGPDLAKVQEWTDADLSGAVSRMQNMVGPLDDVQIKDLVAFLKTPAAAKSLEKKQEEAKAIAAVEQDKEPASATMGHDLFFGTKRFANGGMSCVSCHSSGASGGNLGPDLTALADRMSETAIISACENASFKVMKAAYADHKVTHQEARDLAKYFEQSKGTDNRRALEPAWLAGSAVTAFALVAIGIGYRNRNSAVRKKLTRR